MKGTKFSRLFRLPRIGYRCYVKYKGRMDKTYIEFKHYEDDVLIYETFKYLATIWSNFDDLREEVELQFEEYLECGLIEYVKIEPCLCYIDPWWGRWGTNLFEHMKSQIKFLFLFKMPNYRGQKWWLTKEFGKWKTFWLNPTWDYILPHRWIKNWAGRILYIREKSVLKKEN